MFRIRIRMDPHWLNCPGYESVLAIRIQNNSREMVKLVKINTVYTSSTIWWQSPDPKLDPDPKHAQK